jgi:hypothetical protein
MHYGDMDMEHGHVGLASEWTCKVDIHAEEAVCTCSMDIQHRHAAWTCIMDMLHRMNMHHGHAEQK